MADANAQLDQAKKNLALCLSTDSDCVYGTSNKCMPSVAYTDRFGDRADFHMAHLILGNCHLDAFTAASMTEHLAAWKSCSEKVLQSLPEDALTKMSNNVDDVATRYEAIRRQSQKFGEDCKPKMPLIGQRLWETRSVCRYEQNFGEEQCDASLTEAYDIADAARETDGCLYYAESQLRRDKIKADHDAACHEQYDGSIEKAKANISSAQQAANEAKAAEQKAKQEQERNAANHNQPNGSSPVDAEKKKQQEEAERRREAIERAQKQQEEATEHNNENIGNVAQLAMLMPGGGTTASGTTGYFAFRFGGGFEILPVPEHVSSSVGSGSNTTIAAGIGPSLNVEYWPVFSPVIDLGAFGHASIGVMELAGGGTFVFRGEGGGQVSLGIDSGISVLFQFAAGYQSGSTSSDTTTPLGDSISSSGSVSQTYQRIATGLHFCSDGNSDSGFCDTAVDLLGGVERASDDPQGVSGTPLTLEARVTLRRSLMVDVHSIVGLPLSPNNALNANAARGFGIGVDVSKSLDYFGDPYVASSSSGKLSRRHEGPLFLTLAALSIGGGLLLDLSPASAHDHKFQVLDMVPIALYVMGGASALYGGYLLR